MAYSLFSSYVRQCLAFVSNSCLIFHRDIPMEGCVMTSGADANGGNIEGSLRSALPYLESAISKAENGTDRALVRRIRHIRGLVLDEIGRANKR